MRKKVDDYVYHIGSHIRTARMRADLTQEQLSESIGVTSQYLSDLERGLVGTSISTLIKICRRLNVSSDFILFGESSPAYNGNPTLVEKVRSLPEPQAKVIEATVDLMLGTVEMEPTPLIDPKPLVGISDPDDR